MLRFRIVLCLVMGLVLAACHGQKAPGATDSQPAASAAINSPLAAPTAVTSEAVAPAEATFGPALPTATSTQPPTPTVTDTPTAAPATVESPLAAPEGIVRYQGETIFTGSGLWFEVFYDAQEWTLSDVTLVSQSIDGCELLLQEGPREYYPYSDVTLAGKEWGIVTPGPGTDWGFFIYILRISGPGSAIFRVTVPADATPEVQDECRRRAESVLETFRFLEE